MNYAKISICQYPTTTILVDDNEDFLARTSTLLNAEGLLSYVYAKSQKALDFLNKEYRADPFINRCTTTTPDRDIDTMVLHFDYRKIHHEIYHPRRFQQISALVADYAMPRLNGLEFCREVSDDFIKKLILTGEAGNELAVEAFNEGSIDKFLEKSALDLPELLVKNVRDLQKKYFLELSEMALNKAMNDLYKQTPACLSDPIFIKFFNDLKESNGVIEHYLLDEHGSFLFLDMYGNPSWLVVKSDKDMQDLAEHAHLQDAPHDIIAAFQQRTIVPYFHTDEDLQVPFDKCQPYLHPATKFEGKQLYYYSYVKEPDAYQLDRDKIVSFQKYQEQSKSQ